MRNEQEMLQLIVDTALQDERIRAVIMNGSRANPNAPRDIFQDFDIVYIVTDVAAFKNNDEWIKRFGEIMIMQKPEYMRDPPPSDDGRFSYLMQFTDGNRIDLNLFPIDRFHSRFPRRATETTCQTPLLPKRFPITAMNSGGYASTSLKDCGEKKSSTPKPWSTRSSGSS
jgi:hypothetical protein